MMMFNDQGVLHLLGKLAMDAPAVKEIGITQPWLPKDIHFFSRKHRRHDSGCRRVRYTTTSVPFSKKASFMGKPWRFYKSIISRLETRESQNPYFCAVSGYHGNPNQNILPLNHVPNHKHRASVRIWREDCIREMGEKVYEAREVSFAEGWVTFQFIGILFFQSTWSDRECPEGHTARINHA